MSDETQVAWNDMDRLVSCGGNCNVIIITTTAGVTENQADVFRAACRGRGRRRAEKNAGFYSFKDDMFRQFP